MIVITKFQSASVEAQRCGWRHKQSRCWRCSPARCRFVWSVLFILRSPLYYRLLPPDYNKTHQY